jgi:hypothetical protein
VLMHLGLLYDLVADRIFFFLKKSCKLLLLCPIFGLTSTFCFGSFWQKSCWLFYRIMSAISSQRRVRQRTEEERNDVQAKIMDRNVIAERNVVRADIMVPPLDSIFETIQTYH